MYFVYIRDQHYKRCPWYGYNLFSESSKPFIETLSMKVRITLIFLNETFYKVAAFNGFHGDYESLGTTKLVGLFVIILYKGFKLS